MNPRLLIVAAGTGGHIVPGLAVAAEAQQRGWSVQWLGSDGPMEARLVPQAGLTLHALPFRGLRGKSFSGRLQGSWGLLRAFWRSLQTIRQQRIDLVLGMGGYLCVPAGLAAWLLRRPLVLVNADAQWLLSNRWLAPLARRVAFGLAGPQGPSPKVVVTGNPVRAAIEALPAPAVRYAQRQGRLRVLVVGGSLGAQVLNRCVPQALALMPPEQRPEVLHQTGAAHVHEVRQRYQQAGLAWGPELRVQPFVDDMAQELAQADLVLCRAGAITVSELCAAGVASWLVPLVVSTTSHQRDNALHMARHGAAQHWEQSQLTPEALALAWRQCRRDDLSRMAQAARALAQPQAAARVVDTLQAELRQP